MVRPLLLNFDKSLSKDKPKKIFMNSMLLKIVASLLDCKTDLKGSSIKAPKGSENNSRSFLEHLNYAQKGSLKHSITSLPGSSCGQKRFDFYLDSLKKALLAKGKPLNNVAIKTEDLPVVKAFLLKCGFPENKAAQLITDLLDNHPDGKINLSHLFQKLTEAAPPEDKNRSGNVVETAAVPHIESILRGFGLTQNQVDGVFSAAKSEDGRLNPDILAEKLSAITNRQNNKSLLTAVQRIDQQLADKLESFGVHIPKPDKTGRLSLKDFISSLEQMAGDPKGEEKLPSEVKATMDNLLAKVVGADEKTSTPSYKAMDPNSKAHVNDVLLSPFMNKDKANDVLLSPFMNKDKAVDKKNLRPSLKGAGKTGKNVKSPAFVNQGDSPKTTIEQQQAPATDQAGKVTVLADLNSGRGLKQQANKENHAFKSKSRTVNMIQSMTGSTLSETAQAVNHSDKPQNLMPMYLVDQVGRQISRAILRGDRVIRLNLKPPELGAVKIEMAVKDNTVNLEVVTENKAAKEILLANIHELREALLGQDVKLVKMDVQVGCNFNQSMADAGKWHQNGQKNNQDSSKELSLAENNTKDTQLKPNNIITNNQLLNLVA